MKSVYLCSLVLVIFCVCVQSQHLAKYIKPCRKDDPKLNECAMRHAKDALPFIIKGDRKTNSPALNPLKLPLVSVDASQDLKISLTDAVLSGLDLVKIEDVNIDLQRKHIAVRVSSKLLNLLGTYKMQGKILILPITGEGPANMTFYNGVFDYSLDYGLVKKSDNQEYITFLKSSVKYRIEKSQYQFDNLFNGDKRLGDQMNKFLNENYKEVSKDISPAVSETINIIATTVLKALLGNVPFNEIFI